MKNIDRIRELIADDFIAVNDRISERLRSEIVLINELSQYIINSGGKRLRPMMALLAAKACGYQGSDHIQAAAIIEFIHTATLLHDDVVDASQLRRGQETANAVFGNEASVLVGDFLYSRAFEMMVEIDQVRLMSIFANTTNVIAEGEVMQLLNIRNPDISENDYLRVILSKTAKLFEAATLIGAILARQSSTVEQAMAHYGMHVGTCFQLVDDVLDYTASSSDIGKNIGDDLAEGKPTLPLIYALHQAPSEKAQQIRHAIMHGGKDQADDIIDIVRSCGAIDYAMQAAQREADQACISLNALPDNTYSHALRELAQLSVQRIM